MAGEAIGGYFELEIGTGGQRFQPQALRFQSGRAAFLALLEARKPKLVWIPRYICSSVVDTLHQANIPFNYYRIDSSLRIAELIVLADDELLFYVNYFGVRDCYINDLLAKYRSSQVVIDCTQSLFSPPFDCLATIYSPRKFVGVPDGGLLTTRLPVALPDAVDVGSYERLLPMIKRLAFSPEAGFEEHRVADMTLALQPPLRMSNLTSRLLDAVDFAHVAGARLRNFRFLHAALAEVNSLDPDDTPSVAPMCYPLITCRSGFRNFLIQRRIFVPRYWPGVGEAEGFGVERFLAEHIVPLPCDQRYDEAAMQRIVDAWHEFREKQENTGALLSA